MLIDNKGKLFGKISIVDIVIVILIIGIAGFSIYNRMKPSDDLQFEEDGEDIIVTFLAVTPSVFTELISIGDKVKPQRQNFLIGEVADIRVTDTIEYTFNSEGKSVTTSRPNSKEVTLNLKTKGSIGKNTVKIGDRVYRFGNNHSLVAGKVALWAKVVDVSRLEENENDN